MRLIRNDRQTLLWTLVLAIAVLLSPCASELTCCAFGAMLTPCGSDESSRKEAEKEKEGGCEQSLVAGALAESSRRRHRHDASNDACEARLANPHQGTHRQSPISDATITRHKHSGYSLPLRC